MAVTISFAIQKGGVGKTTTTGITAWLLSKEARVLVVDFDSQGNLTQLLTQKNVYDFTGKTILEAVKAHDPRPFIHPVSDTLHVLPAEDLLATFSRWLYRDYRGEPASVLYETLAIVKADYDYILIDCPPNLGDQTVNALVASDFTVALLQSEPFCLDALYRFLDLTEHVKGVSPQMSVAGILTTMMDARAATDSLIIEKAKQDYEEHVFDTIIRRRSRIKDFTMFGITDKSVADRHALTMYQTFVEELKVRVR